MSIDRIVIPLVFRVEKFAYLESAVKWQSRPLIVNLFDLLMFCYTITVGHIPAVQVLVRPFFEQNGPVGIQAFEYVTAQSRHLGNALLLPGLILFLAAAAKIADNAIPPQRRLLYRLAGIGVPLCIVLLSVAGGSSPPARSLLVLPFASAFMVFFLVKTYKKKAAAVVACLALAASVYQAEITAQLFYSDYLRYNEQARVAFDLKEKISAAQSGERAIPVVIAGKYESLYRSRPNFLPGEILGTSPFGYNNRNPPMQVLRSLDFLETLGIHFETPDEDQLKLALNAAKSMPSYPDPGCVKRLPGMARDEDVIVVKMGDL